MARAAPAPRSDVIDDGQYAQVLQTALGAVRMDAVSSDLRQVRMPGDTESRLRKTLGGLSDQARYGAVSRLVAELSDSPTVRATLQERSMAIVVLAHVLREYPNLMIPIMTRFLVASTQDKSK